jgi:hypothetical protein
MDTLWTPMSASIPEVSGADGRELAPQLRRALEENG